MAETRGARQVSAREAARLRAAELAEQFDAQAALRRRLAADVLLTQAELEEFAAETDRRAAKVLADAEERAARLRLERAQQAVAKRSKLDRLVVELLDTGVSPKEAGERLGMTPADVRLAKKNHDAETAASGQLDQAAEVVVPSQQDGAPAEADLVGSDGPGSAAG